MKLRFLSALDKILRLFDISEIWGLQQQRNN